MTKLFVGIDPGLDGAIAHVGEDGWGGYDIMPTFTEHVLHNKQKRQYNIPEFIAILARLQRDYAIPLTMVERQQAFPQQGGVSNFTIGCSYYMCLTALHSLNLPFEIVKPKEWQKSINITGKYDKGKVVSYAIKRFPKTLLIPYGKRVPHSGAADALCIAEYARLKYAGGAR